MVLGTAPEMGAGVVTGADTQAPAVASETLLENLLEHLADGVFTTNRRGRILYWSHSAERLTGIDAERARGRSAREVLGPQLAPLLEGPPGTHEVLCEFATGAFPLRVATVVVAGPGGTILGRACALRDLRARFDERAQQRQQDALASLGRTVATVVHQLRNPLGAALGFLGLAQQGAATGDVGRAIAKAREGLLEVDRRIGELLTYMRPRPLRLGRTDLRLLIASTLEDVAARFPQGPRFELQVPVHLTAIADPDQVRQALENLMVNAAEETGPAGRVVVLGQTRQRASGESEVRLLVRNTGGQLAPTDLALIFEPFISRKNGGTGLGLPLARRIAEDHGGSLAAVSAGGWTTFVITLPEKPTTAGKEPA